MADILQALIAVSQRAGGNFGKLDNLPKRSEFLKAWVLPVLGEAVAEDEKEQDALALYNFVKNLGNRK